MARFNNPLRDHSPALRFHAVLGAVSCAALVISVLPGPMFTVLWLLGVLCQLLFYGELLAWINAGPTAPDPSDDDDSPTGGGRGPGDDLHA